MSLHVLIAGSGQGVGGCGPTALLMVVKGPVAYNRLSARCTLSGAVYSVGGSEL